MTSLSVVADHLWQSTLFAAGVWALTVAFRRHDARVRYWLWMAASVKFLVPFAALVAVGQWLAWESATSVRPDMPVVVTAMGQPFSPVGPAAIALSSRDVSTVMGWLPAAFVIVWAAGCALHLVTWLVRWRRLASTARAATPVESGIELMTLRRLERRVGAAPLSLVAADSRLEPAIVGLRTPVLLWPARLSDRLEPEQIEAVLAHELCHARHRDNVSMTVHMIVEALFWFYPVVWWLERPLIRERERACDEDVLRLGSRPETYAESILKTCQYSLESPLRCAAGVTGADLKRRIEEIMTRDFAAIPLTRWKTRALAGTGATAIGVPIVVGILLSAPSLRAQFEPVTAAMPRFEVASVKRNVADNPEDGQMARPLPGGGYRTAGFPLFNTIRGAYDLQPAQLVGAPSWVNDERYDIEARAPGATPPQMRVMMRALLFDRFGMRAHAETRELPVYVLMPVKPGVPGPGLKPTGECGKAQGPPDDAPGRPLPCGILQSGAGQLNASGGVPMQQLASAAMLLASYTGVDRIVLDRSGLTGNYGFELRFTPVGGGGGLAVSSNPDAPQRPDFFTALQEQLGLKLESQRAPIEVLVIDRIERPTPD